MASTISDSSVQVHDEMRCFVPSCKKYRRDNPNLTYLRVPEPLKEVWCKALEINCPKKLSYVCDEHINIDEDCYGNKSGRLRLKCTANLTLTRTYPKTEMVSEDPEEIMEIVSTTSKEYLPNQKPEWKSGKNMTLEDARAALLAKILGGGDALANRASSSANPLDNRALQQIVDGCFVKLHQLRLLNCDACEEVFHKRSRLMIHYFDTHVNEDLKESDITTGASVDVKKFTPGVSNLGRTNINHLKLHPCNICGESFAFKVDMKIHKLKHSGKEPQECEICQNLFLDKNSLKTHINTCHTAENLYTCDVCNKQFHALRYLKQHKKLHSDIKPYTCEFCKKKFALKEYMIKHRRSHSGETPYTCVCGKQFCFHSSFKSHQCAYNINKTQQSKKELQCDYCRRKYKLRANLINHIKLHMNPQIYSCDYCCRKFNSPFGLKLHRAKHTGDLPHSCSVCNSKFAMKSILNEHMLTHRKEKLYSCDICDKRFAKKHNVTAHLKVHTKIYQCTMCNISFHDQNRLDIHLRAKHTGDLAYPCIVGNKFVEKYKLNQHMLTHTNEKGYSCGTCDKWFARKDYLIKHLKVHIKAYQCTMCNISFHDKNRLNIHLRAKHTGDLAYPCIVGNTFIEKYKPEEKVYSCDICDKRFAKKHCLIQHLKVHTKAYQCTVCKISFNHENRLDSHVRAKHLGNLPYICIVCSSKFTDKCCLNRHMLTHTKEKVYSCDICDKRYGRKDNLISHLKVHTKAPYQCTMCNMSFHDQNRLDKHLRAKHSGDLTMYPCIVCGRKIAEKASLNRHMLTHTKEKAYSCDLCDKRFARKDYLIKHLKVHTKAYYQCTMCKISFHHKNRLDRHLQQCQLKSSSVKLLKIKRSKAKKSIRDSDSSFSNE